MTRSELEKAVSRMSFNLEQVEIGLQEYQVAFWTGFKWSCDWRTFEPHELDKAKAYAEALRSNGLDWKVIKIMLVAEEVT